MAKNSIHQAERPAKHSDNCYNPPTIAFITIEQQRNKKVDRTKRTQSMHTTFIRHKQHKCRAGTAETKTKIKQKKKSHGGAIVLHLRAESGLSLLEAIPLGVQALDVGGSRRSLLEERRQRLPQGRADVGEQVRRPKRIPEGSTSRSRRR